MPRRMTNHTRLKLDLVIEFDRESDGLPSNLPSPQELVDAISALLERRNGLAVDRPQAVCVLPGARVSWSMGVGSGKLNGVLQPRTKGT